MTNSVELQEYITALLQKGLRVTPQRKHLLRLILGFNRPFAAVELYKEMIKQFPGMSYGTVYHNLRLYTRLRIVESLALVGEIRYRMIERRQPTFNFTCMDCEKTVDMVYHPEQLSLPLPRRYTSVDYKLDVYGYCLDCSGEASDEHAGTFHLGGMTTDDESNRNRPKNR